MLQEMRDKVQSWVAYVIVGLLILSFGLWGISSYLHGGSSDTTVAVVNGQKLSYRDFMDSYNDNLRIQRTRLGANFSPTEEFQNALKQQTLQSIVSRMGINAYLTSGGYRVSSEQAEQEIFELPVFQDNGQFSPNKYKQLLASNLMTDAEFVAKFQSSMLLAQPELGINKSSFVLGSEVDADLALMNQKRSFDYVAVAPAQVKPKPVQASEIKDYYDAHIDSYQVPEQVTASYIELSLSDIEKSVSTSDEQVDAYYAQHISDFTVDGEAAPLSKVRDKVAKAYKNSQAKVIYANKLDQLTNISFEQPDTLEPAAKAIGAIIKKTAYFANVPSKDGVTANAAFVAAAYSDDVLLAGNNSDPIEIEEGKVVVLRINDHTAAHAEPLENVKAKVVKALENKALRHAMLDKATAIKAELEKNGHFNASKYDVKHAVKVGRYNKDVAPELLMAVFIAPPVKGTTGMIPMQNQDVVVYQITGITPAEKALEKEREAFGLQQTKVNANVESMLLQNQAIAGAKIKINNESFE